MAGNEGSVKEDIMENYKNIRIVRSQIKTTTPDIAKKMLLQNKGNRKISVNRVLELARYMEQGKWVDTGQSLIVSIGGNLLDGQQRLSAIVKSNTTQKLNIVTVEDIYGNELDAIGLPIDRHKARTFGDILGEDARTIQTARCLIRDLAINGSNLVKDALVVSSIIDRLRNGIEKVNSVSRSKMRVFSQAGIRACMALRYEQGYDYLELYESVVRENYNKVPNVWMSWSKKMFELGKPGDRSVRKTSMGHTWALTIPNNEPNKTHNIKKPFLYLEDMMKVFYELCGDLLE